MAYSVQKCISADSHFNEPPDFYDVAWKEFGDQVPHIETQVSGDFWVAGEFKRPLGVMNRPGERGQNNRENLSMEATDWFTDLDKRTGHILKDGVHGEVLFPSGAMLHTMQDGEAKQRCFDIYNDFAYSLRGFYQGVLMVQDNPVEALASVNNYKKPGTVFMLPLYSRHGSIAGAKWEKVLDALDKQEAIVAFHAGTMDAGLRQLPQHEFSNTFVFKTGRLFFQAHQLLNELILGGVPAKTSSLRFLISELGASWVPYTVHRLLEGLDIYKEFPITRSEVIDFIRNRMFFTVQFDFPTFGPSEAEPLHFGNVLFGSDFPHVESTYGATDDCKLRLKHRYGSNAEYILFSNAKSLFARLDA